VEFRPTLTRQRDHAAQHNQPERAAMFEHLLDAIDDEEAS